MTNNCKQCEKEFATTSSRIREGKGKFCSKTCYTNYQHHQDIANIINHHCIVCSKGMRLTPYLRKMNRNCCSIKCQHELQKERVARTCLTCKKKFECVPSGNKVFCSRKCKENKLRRELTCEYCHKKFVATIRQRGHGKKHYFCSNKCKFIWCQGKPHPKMSEWLAKNISNGTFHPHSKNYKQGYIINKSCCICPVILPNAGM